LAITHRAPPPIQCRPMTIAPAAPLSAARQPEAVPHRERAARALAMDAVEQAKSGPPGMPMA